MSGTVLDIEATISSNKMYIPFNLRKLLFRLQLEDRNFTPRLQLVPLLAGLRIWLVHHSSAQFHESLHAPLCGLLPCSYTECQRANLVNLVFLGISRLAAAVENVVPLLAIGAVEDARKRFFKEGLVLVCVSSGAQ